MKRFKWQEDIVYQIYPRSFMDSNGDGMGDIPGITSKLDYLEALGVTKLWLCPVCCSPMADNGYDISDYDHIDPVFGTDEDFDRLILEAGKRGIGIVMDIVVNHCSSEHRWFRNALEDPEGPYGKYFYIRRGTVEHGSPVPPNNWRSFFGGSAWEPIPGTDLFYLHLFAKGQPDLNWENQNLREEIYAMMNRWLVKGVQGFRMDAISYLQKEEGLPSYPADADDGLVSVKYGTLNKPGLIDILREMRDRTYGRDILTVGEAMGVTGEEMTDFIGLEDGVFSMIFDFSFNELNVKAPNYFWYDTRSWSIGELKEKMFGAHESTRDAWLGTCLECHDQPRSIDHYLPEEGRNFYGASMLAMFNLFRRGTPYIYQGEEIGMRNIRLASIEEYDDVSTKNQYQIALEAGYSPEEAIEFVYGMSRDNSRTPFQWNHSANAGFTNPETVPWLPVHPNYTEINAEDEAADPASLLAWYRCLIEIRKNSEILKFGDLEPEFRDEEDLVSFRRILDGRELLVVLCWRNCETELALSGIKKKLRLIADNYGDMKTDGKRLILRPYEALCAEMVSEGDV